MHIKKTIEEETLPSSISETETGTSKYELLHHVNENEHPPSDKRERTEIATMF